MSSMTSSSSERVLGVKRAANLVAQRDVSGRNANLLVVRLSDAFIGGIDDEERQQGVMNENSSAIVDQSCLYRTQDGGQRRDPASARRSSP